jgi:SDR family mycofactocin-dependent oxidoreductase
VTRIALVTGAARGIGAATVRGLAAQGWAVLAVDRCADDPALPYPLGTRAELDRVAAEASAAAGDPGVVRALAADARDAPAMAEAVAEAERRWGGLDAAVAVAGVIAGGVPLWEMPAEQQQAVLDTDLGGVFALARAAIPALLRRPEPRSGRFLAVASAAATRGMPMLVAYCAAKAGVTGLIRALAAELGDTESPRTRSAPALPTRRCWPRARGCMVCRPGSPSRRSSRCGVCSSRTRSPPHWSGWRAKIAAR